MPNKIASMVYCCLICPVIVLLYVLFLKSALNCILKNEKYLNCCIMFELIEQNFGINIKEIVA